MRFLVLILPLICCIIFSCSNNPYSEEEMSTLNNARTAYLEALKEYGEAFNKVSSATKLQDSLDQKLNAVNRMLSVESADTDSLNSIISSLSEASENLTTAKNNVLQWTDSIYGMPDIEGIYDDDSSKSAGIAVDAGNDMISNNIKMRKAPEGSTPDDLKNLQEDQLARIRNIHDKLVESVNAAENVLAENL